METSFQWLTTAPKNNHSYRYFVIRTATGLKQAAYIRLARHLIQGDIQDGSQASPGNPNPDPDNKEVTGGSFSVDFDLANSLIIQLMNSVQRVHYSIYALKQVLLLVKMDYPILYAPYTPYELIDLMEHYFPLACKNATTRIMLKRMLFECIRKNDICINDTPVSSCLRIVQAIKLVVYAAIFAISHSLRSPLPLTDDCTRQAVYTAIECLPSLSERNAMLKKVAEFGLTMLEGKQKGNTVNLQRRDCYTVEDSLCFPGNFS